MPKALEDIGNNTFENIIDGNSRVEIGDRESSGFEPKVKALRWGETGLSVGLAESGGRKSQVDENTVEWKKGDITATFYRNDNPKLDYRGPIFRPARGFEFDIKIDKKPASNRVPLSIEMDGVKMLSQKRLSLAECWDNDLNVNRIIQPVNVGNSIAVYGQKRNNKYRSGKVAHIPAPFIYDSAGRVTIGSLQVISDSQVDVIIPAGFYAFASWPVVIDPYIGFSSQGGSDLLIANNIHANVWPITEHGEGIEMHGYVKNTVGGTANYAKTNILIGDGGTDYLDNATTNPVLTGDAYSDETFVFASGLPYLESGTEYMLAVWGNQTGSKSKKNAYCAYDEDVDISHYSDAETFSGSWPVPPIWVDGGFLYKLSLWIDYNMRPEGEVSMSFSERAPGISAAERRPGLGITSRAPNVGFS